MLRQKLAERLVAAKNETERKRLLAENKDQADAELAFALKEICLTAYSAEPSKTRKTVNAFKTLMKFNQSQEIEAYLFWVLGIAEITKGNLNSAIKNLDHAAGVFKKIKQEHNSAQTQVAKLIPLALLGKYNLAIKTGKNALKIFEKYGDELSAGKMEKNLGNLVARRGEERLAEEFYLSAMRRFKKINDEKELTMSENSLANTYAELNNFRKAENFYSQALERAKKNKMKVTVAEIEASMGNLATFRGKFDEALKYLELSRQKYETLKMPHQNAIAELEIADIYLELNLAEEAFSIYKKVADELHKLKMQGEEAHARANFGKAATIMKKESFAKDELKKSAKLYLTEENKIGAAVVKLTEAILELDSQKFQNALKLAKEAAKLLSKSGYIRHKLTANWIQGEALRNLGKYSKAGEFLAQTFSESLKQEQRSIAQNAKNSLGKLALQKGDKTAAKKHFKKAIELIETLREPLPAEEFRMAFLADKLVPFENLAKIYLAENDLEKAFFCIERSRSRSLAENLEDRSKLKSRKKDKNTAKSEEKLKNLREELNWFYSRLNRAEEDEIENLQKEAKSREKQIADLMRRIQSVRSGNDKVNTNVANLSGNSIKDGSTNLRSSLQNFLGKQKALIEFVNFEGNISAFVITDKQIKYIANLAKESEIIELLESLQFQFGALRYGAKNLERFMPELKKRADIYLQKLYEKLLLPLEKNLEERDLIIVPVGSLHYVPFNALRNKEKYLVEDREIVYSPSASIWQSLVEKPSTVLKSALLIGFADERIPLVNKEIKTLKKIFAKTKTLVDKSANFSNYKMEAEKFDVLHLACHGQFRPDNPLFSSLHLADGFVTVRDICSQRLNAGLVTLSACETGLNKIFAGDEILGLARGFLSAGASSLVLSLWTVNDKATAKLMQDFYTDLKKGKTPSNALKTAQCNFIKENFHPYFWSPFVIIGK